MPSVRPQFSQNKLDKVYMYLVYIDEGAVYSDKRYTIKRIS